ncbi:Upstream of FLC [Sesbania bispinosa]|nr:Upstream of FLC [Sesbania bispinosa]
MDVRSQRCSRETSPDRAKICRLKQKVKPARKVQVVYYLSRNGLLEHPHFMEVTLLPNQPLRLKDVFDRLMALRGSSMPLQYSWSSKRNYKSGYVWYDLALKDIIHPSEGGEYVLKGSELVEGCSGVSTEEVVDDEDHVAQNNATNTKAVTKTNRSSTHSNAPSNSTTTTLAEKLNQKVVHSNYPKRLGDGGGGEAGGSVSVTSASSRYSVLLQLIACGSSGSEFKAKHEPRLSNVGTNIIKQRESVDKADHKPFSSEADEEVIIHKCVSENPRMLLGNLQSEEKEYFSGSLVESMKAKAEPVLKRSNSYNEERRSKLGMEEVKMKEMEEDKRETKGGVKEKCIPLKKSSKESRK